MASVDYTKFTYDDVLGDLKTLASGAEQYYSPNGDEIDAAPDEEVPDTVGIDPQAKVSQMANRALNNRS